MGSLPEMVLCLAGAAIVLVILFDVGMAVVHPSLRGRLSALVHALVWWVVARAFRARRPRLLRIAGPLALVANFVTWVAGLAGGFALVVAASDALRLLTVIEATTGFAIFKAAISYVLSVYSAVSELRTSAAYAYVRGMGDPRRAAELVQHGGAGESATLLRELTATQQALRRYPVLLCSHPSRGEKSLYTLLRGAFVLRLVLGFGVDREQTVSAAADVRALAAALDRLVEDVRAEFLGPSRRPVEPLNADDAAPITYAVHAADAPAVRAAA